MVTITATCIVYRCDGSTALRVRFAEDERGVRVRSVEVSRA